VGRAWCGYACPQTVWTDLFQHVDRLIDGDRNARCGSTRRRGAGQDSRARCQVGIYLAIAFWTGGAWIIYFADAPTLCAISGPARRPVAYATVARADR
jgi:polyferredoxin